VVLLFSTSAFAETPPPDETPHRPKLIEVAPDKDKKFSAPKSAVTPPPPVVPQIKETPKAIPEKLKGRIQLVPVYAETGKTDQCLYLFENRCFQSLGALRRFLLEGLRECRKDASLNIKSTTVRVLEEEEFVEKAAYEFDGKTLTESGLYLYLVDQYLEHCKGVAGKKDSKPENIEPVKEETRAPATAPARVEAEKPKEPEGYDNFADEPKRELGTWRSKTAVFLRSVVHSRAGQFGPSGRMKFPEAPTSLTNRHPKELYHSQSKVNPKVCLHLDEVLKLAPESMAKDISDGNSLDKLVPYLLTDIDGEIEPKSLAIEEKDGKKDLCYTQTRGMFYVNREDVAEVNAFYAKAFEKYDALAKLPPQLLMELKVLWETSSDTDERLYRIEHFWRTKVKYLLDDYTLYRDYFAKNPEANLVRAACEIGQGRCVPKNFGLAVTVHELSKGQLAVRMDGGFVLSHSDKEPRPILSSVAHLGIQVLVPNPKTGIAVWKTVEASVGSETIAELEKRMAENKQILDLIREKVGGRKRIRVPLQFTRYSESTLTVSGALSIDDGNGVPVDVGQGVLESVSTKKFDEPTTVKRALIFTENANGDLQISGEKGLADLVTGDFFPKTSIADVTGSERFLAAFLGYAEYSNQKSFGRTWKHLGEDRYSDARLLRVYLPDGSYLEEMQVLTFNFARPSILERVDGYLNGEKSYQGIVED